MYLQKIKPPQITESMISDVVTKIVENPHPEKIVLFGSQAWGGPREWSDIDILVIINFNESSSRIAAKISMTAKPRLVPMDILVRTPEEIGKRIKMDDYFIQRIFSEGRVLYERRAG